MDLDTDAAPRTGRLPGLTERYCVVYQTLASRPELGVVLNRPG